MATTFTKLEEELAFAKAKVIAYKRVQVTYATRMQEIQQERKNLAKQEQYLIGVMREIDDGALTRAERSRDELQIQKDKLRESVFTKGAAKGKTVLRKKLDQADRLKRQIQELLDLHGLTMEEVKKLTS